MQTSKKNKFLTGVIVATSTSSKKTKADNRLLVGSASTLPPHVTLFQTHLTRHGARLLRGSIPHRTHIELEFDSLCIKSSSLEIFLLPNNSAKLAKLSKELKRKGEINDEVPDRLFHLTFARTNACFNHDVVRYAFSVLDDTAHSPVNFSCILVIQKINDQWLII